MPIDLALGDRAYSSWSLRGWLLFDAFGIPVRTHFARLYTEAFPALLQDYAPARTVPAMKLDDGTVVADSLAIAEELASRFPEAGIWPAAPRARAVARQLAAEMHSGFTALRGDCAMNLRVSYTESAPSEAVLADLARLEAVWAWARAESDSGTPWLSGAYSAADAFFAPVAGRLAGYNLPVGEAAAAYVEAHLHHPSFRRWRAMGLVDGPDQPVYAKPYPTRAWPGPEPLAAQAVVAGPSVNAACPYSGDPVTHFLEMDGRVWGFCNAFCRDKTVADPEAWPAFMKMVRAV
ncbi:glutathione S-transferase N-terminal domain-containing protein [Acidimangrovimonas pyrenivorans]|uniref:Glutathione S-transferase N-terminal domain-containing protein n=1 Tax=Acidimangrovimonas pyrenivorans TaxID=2030798 RepID=A0ABV7AL33_9RHOB